MSNKTKGNFINFFKNRYLEEIFFGGEIRDICVPVESNIESNILPIPGIFIVNMV